jgi:hypothetical protein
LHVSLLSYGRQVAQDQNYGTGCRDQGEEHDDAYYRNTHS